MCHLENPGFACTACGECCRDDQIIRLNGDDLDLLCRYLDLPGPAALEQAGYIEYVTEAPGFPRPRLSFRRKPFRFCPFLANTVDDAGRIGGRCALHPDFKPLVCRLSPLARLVDDRQGRAVEEWQFVLPVEGCPGAGRAAFDAAGEIAGLRLRLDRETEWMRQQLRLAAGRAGTAPESPDSLS